MRVVSEQIAFEQNVGDCCRHVLLELCAKQQISRELPQRLAVVAHQ